MPTTIESKTKDRSSQPVVRRENRAFPIRPHVIGAIFRRNFLGYFSNPSGYVFLVLFVLVCSFAQFWQDSFFANNLANLDPLNQLMPLLLLFFVPAITMSIWADERKQGTDELLLTLPAHDIEVILGKYFGALGIYTVALVFLALGHYPVLRSLGSPDLGVFAATYVGYWLMGAALIAIGMVASFFTGSVTIAFILGAVFCAIPVLTGFLGSALPAGFGRLFEEASIPAQFRDFGTGVIPLPSVLYFVLLTLGMLYLNMVLLGRRHWAGGQESTWRWAHAMTRIVAVGFGIFSLSLLIGRLTSSARADVTQERLHTLSSVSQEIVKNIPSDRPVFIQAYYSPDVPRELVQTKNTLLNTLREIAALGGDRIRLSLVETTPFSEQARDAEKRHGITARTVRTLENATQSTQDIYLGVAFTSGLEEVVVSFFDRGLPVEYELTRSIRTVSGAKRKKVGILNTDAKLMGGMDFRNFTQENEWLIVTELKKQYDVVQANADSDLPKDLDALLVAQPSSLTQRQIDNLTAYIRNGGPTLLLMDPFPTTDPGIAPEEPRMPPGGMMGGQQPEPKGNLTPLLELLGIDWPTTSIVWNPYNPHRQLELPPEYVFIGTGSGARTPFGTDLIASGLQEVVLLYPGLIRKRPDIKTEFTPLLITNDSGGILQFQDLMQRNPLGMMSMNRARSYDPSGLAYTLAARIKGPLPAAPPNPGAKPEDANAQKQEGEAKVIAIADLDMISDGFFMLRRREEERFDIFQFDNVTFVLNCVDSLAGDDSFIELRKRRPAHRTLLKIEEQTNQFVEDSQKEMRKAEQNAKLELQKAQGRLDAEVQKIRENNELDARTKEAMAEYKRAVESRKLDVITKEIQDQERQAKLVSKANEQSQIRSIRNGVRARAILLPGLPVLLLGAIVWAIRSNRENRGANPNRLA